MCMIMSKFERDIGLQLGVIVFVFFMLELVVVTFRLLQALSVCPSENVVGQYPFTESSVSR